MTNIYKKRVFLALKKLIFFVVINSEVMDLVV